MTPPTDHPLPVWQSALLAHGCQLQDGEKVLSLDLHPLGDRIVCTPTATGSMMPFDVRVSMGQPVTITWDSELSRYIVQAIGRPVAA